MLPYLPAKLQFGYVLRESNIPITFYAAIEKFFILEYTYLIMTPKVCVSDTLPRLLQAQGRRWKWKTIHMRRLYL